MLSANRNSPVACWQCARTVPRRARQQRFCSTRCRNQAKNRNRSRKAFLGPARHPTLGGEPNPLEKANKNKAVQRRKSGPSPPILPPRRPAPLGARNLPPEVVPDERWQGMYRVRLADGSLSDMLNLARAKDLVAAASEGAVKSIRIPRARAAWIATARGARSAAMVAKRFVQSKPECV
jgi:hypothetical protein